MPLWLWLWIHAGPLVIVLTLLLIAWLFGAVRRFGPMQPVPPPARRRVLEHIEAAGHFLWKQNQRHRLVEGVRHLRNAVAKGLPEAMNELGVCYATGWGVDRDPAEAIEWFRKAAAAGDVNAQFNLGVLHLRGKGVEQDYRQAYEWLERAASDGDLVTAAMRDKFGELLEVEPTGRVAS